MEKRCSECKSELYTYMPTTLLTLTHTFTLIKQESNVIK